MRETHICLTFGLQRTTRVGIKVHIGRKHCWDKHTSLECPYFPETFSALQTLSRNLRDFARSCIKQKEGNVINREHELGNSMVRYTQY